MIGRKISHYTILDKLGSGGMGVVYKAEDTKLQRLVALKFLPMELTQDKSTRERFIQEARAASSLDHPNICTIHQIAELPDDPDRLFIVMAHYAGETLKEKIERGPLPITETVDIAIQVACALKCAHEQGIVHRDIKPANILVTDRGETKIIDFGLAKLVGHSKITRAGATLGTTAYMSPEQICGDESDARTDIWALGVVLYEMIAGKLPFTGEHEQAIMYAILTREPKSLGNGEKVLERIICNSLEKKREDRYQTTAQVLDDLNRLQNNLTTGSKAEKPRRSSRVRSKRKRTAGMALVAALIATAAFLAIRFDLFYKKTATPKLVEARLLTPTPIKNEDFPALSPHGTRIAYFSRESGNPDIWVQQIASGQRINLTEDYKGKDNFPAWSPDGEWLAFASDRNNGGIFVMAAFGGPVRQISKHWGPPKWSPDGARLVYYTDERKVYIVPVSGGNPVQIPLPHSAYLPDWSPDGSRIVYGGWDASSGKRGIWTVKPDGSAPVTVIEGYDIYHDPTWEKNGRGIFFKTIHRNVRDIWWIPVDAKGEPTGAARALTSGVEAFAPSLSYDGNRIAYTQARKFNNIWSVPAKPDCLSTIADARLIISENSELDFVHLTVSPDGEWLAYHSSRSGNLDIWQMRKNGHDLRQLTSDKQKDIWPSWSPDGSRIAFASNRGGNSDIYVISTDGGMITAITDDPAFDASPAWSPAGDEIAFVSNRSGNQDIWTVSIRTGEVRQLTRHEAKDGYPAWSPDGRSLSFFSFRTGAGELFVLPVEGGEPVQLTHFGSPVDFDRYRNGIDTRSVWAADGKTIYITYQSEIWAIAAKEGAMRKVLEFESWKGLHGDITGVLATDGESLYFSEINWHSDIWLAELVYE